MYWARSCLAGDSDSVHICTETSSIVLEILRANSDASAYQRDDVFVARCEHQQTIDFDSCADEQLFLM
jgi:hypothetical protein